MASTLALSALPDLLVGHEAAGMMACPICGGRMKRASQSRCATCRARANGLKGRGKPKRRHWTPDTLEQVLASQLQEGAPRLPSQGSGGRQRAIMWAKWLKKLDEYHQHIWVAEQQSGHKVCAWCNACESCPASQGSGG